MQARRTEYRGVVFDSKSEAVFARCLDMVHVRWEYHPEVESDHQWDFMVYDIPAGRDGKPVSAIIEYKPAEPTDTYIEELIQSLAVNPVESLLVYGNPWTGPLGDGDWDRCSYITFPIFSSYYWKYGWGDWNYFADATGGRVGSTVHTTEKLFGITEPIVQEARRYRFDLYHALR